MARYAASGRGKTVNGLFEKKPECPRIFVNVRFQIRPSGAGREACRQKIDCAPVWCPGGIILLNLL